MNRAVMYTTTFDKEGIKETTYETGLIPDSKAQEMFVINLYPQKKYQTIEGFGAALTESAGYTLARMSKEKQQEVIEAYYGESGIGYTLGRIHMDSCDFSINNYCAVVRADDPEFQDFNLERDAKYVQPLIKMADQALGKHVRLLLSPWSPPAFMKETGVRNGGGHLKKECYQAYADYVAKYISEYQKRGITIDYMTVQNEPLAVQTWDSCEYTAEEEKVFLRDYLYPSLQANGLEKVALYIWDHNKERVYERTCQIVDETTADMIAGVAFHWYSGDHFETLQMVHEDFPNLKLMHSEGCVEFSRMQDGQFGDDMHQAAMYAHDMIGDLNHGMHSWFDWNLVLDEQGGPNHVGNFCNAPIICDTTTDTIERKPMFYAIAHFSKFIQPGAVRIGCSSFCKELEITAAQNPDGSNVLVIMNNAITKKIVHLRVEGKCTRLIVPENSISTVMLQ
jgi:O-Glycosyl hydrolase